MTLRVSAAGDAEHPGEARGSIGGNVLVTGASRGIGAAIARRLAERGMRLFLTGRDTAALEETRKRLPGDRTHMIETADLARVDDIERLCRAVSDTVDHLDVLILNAGYAVTAPLADTSLTDWDEVFAVNVRAPFLLTQRLLPLLRSGAGRIVAIGSVVATQAYPMQGAYTASKHALRGFIGVLAKELHEEGVIVQIVNPGGVATEMLTRMRPDIAADDQITPDDVAATVAMLLDQTGTAITDEIAIRRRGKVPWG